MTKRPVLEYAKEIYLMHVAEHTNEVAAELNDAMAANMEQVRVLTHEIWVQLPDDTDGAIIIGALTQVMLNIASQFADVALKDDDVDIDKHELMVVFSSAIAKNIMGMAIHNKREEGMKVQ